jgi:hypothetical protein
MSEEQKCPQCGSALTNDALEGLCPVCVLDGAAIFPRRVEPEILSELCQPTSGAGVDECVAAGMLQKAGLITYSRGHVNIVDRSRLENASCECYAIMQQQDKRWRTERSGD